MTLAPIDWAIVVVYIIGCVWAGLRMQRHVHDVDGFAVAERRVKVHLGVTSLAATELGLVTIMYTAQLGFERGLAGAAVGVVICIAMLFAGWTGFVIGPLREAGVMTIPELFEKRFSARVRWVAGLFVALGGLLNMGIFLRLGGDFLVYCVGMPAQWLEAVMTVLLLLVLIYTAMGGMLAVLVTDYLQFLVVGTGMVVTSVLVIRDTGWSALFTSGGHELNPFARSSYGVGYMAWQFVFQIAAVTTWQTMISRVLSTKDSTVAKGMYRWAAFYYVGRFLLPGLWGAAAFLYFQHRGGLPAGLNSLTAMPKYLGSVLPIGLLGVVIAAMIAAEMSTVSGYMLTWETVIFNDLIMPCLKRPMAPRKQLVLTRLILVAIAAFLLFYGLWYRLPGNAWDYLTVTASIYLASVFTLLIGALYWRRANTTGAYAALVLGAIGPLVFLGVNSVATAEHRIAPELAGASSFALAFVGMIAGSLLPSHRARV